MKLEIVVLAAGKGTRMRSHQPKVLQPLGGWPLLGHVLARANALDPVAVHVVYGHGGEIVPAAFPASRVNWTLQDEQLGTGHALAQAMPTVMDDSLVLVLYGDVPLIGEATLRTLIAAANDGLALLTAELEDAGSYGRIIRDGAGRVVRIVERKDATADELAVREINSGFMAAPAARFREWLARLDNRNSQGEYYLTDVVAMAVADGITIATTQPKSLVEILGVNSKQELAQLERSHQLDKARELMDRGVTLRDPTRFDLRGELSTGSDVTIDVNVIIEGDVSLGDGVSIGANNVIRNSRIGANVIIKENCVIEDADIADGCIVGPFARIRPETKLARNVHIGNFVEIKKSDVDAGSKINHLSYVGDSTVGRDVNVGAGTITCNYDGANKHRTVIGDNVFIGSDTQLVAPVTVGAGATVGAGSTITADVPAEELTLSRTQQKTVAGWKRPRKKE